MAMMKISLKLILLIGTLFVLINCDEETTNYGEHSNIQPPEPGHLGLNRNSGPPEPGRTNFNNNNHHNHHNNHHHNNGPPEPGKIHFNNNNNNNGPPEPGQHDLGSSSPFLLPNEQQHSAIRRQTGPPEPGQPYLHPFNDNRYNVPDPIRRTDGIVLPNNNDQIFVPKRTDPLPAPNNNDNIFVPRRTDPIIISPERRTDGLVSPNNNDNVFVPRRTDPIIISPERRTDGLVSPNNNDNVFVPRRTDPIPSPDRRTDGLGLGSTAGSGLPEPGQTSLRRVRDESLNYGNNGGVIVSPYPFKPLDQPIFIPKKTDDNVFGPRYWENEKIKGWECDMRRDNCRLQNRVNFVQFIKSYFLNEPSLVLDIGEAARIKHNLQRINPVKTYNAARLVTTEYFPTRNKLFACLKFSFAWDGEAEKRMHILQRNSEDKCIYSTHSTSRDQSWKDLELQLDLSQGDSAFLIEYAFDTPRKENADYSRSGKIAIRNFQIDYGNCINNQAFDCDLPVR